MIYKLLLILSIISSSASAWKCSCNYNNNKECCPPPDPKHIAFSDPVMICEYINFEGNCFAQSVLPGKCATLERDENDVASSVNTYGKCYRLYEDDDCQGKSVVFAPGTDFHFDLYRLGFNDAASSIGSCFEADKTCSVSKKAASSQDGGTVCRFSTNVLTVGAVPWLVKDRADLPEDGPVQFYQWNPTNNRTEVMEALIYARHLSGAKLPDKAADEYAATAGSPGDRASCVLASRLGGSITDLRNIFPLNTGEAEYTWTRNMEIAVEEEVRAQGVARFTVNLYYRGDADTRPYLIVSRLYRESTGQVIVINDFLNSKKKMGKSGK